MFLLEKIIGSHLKNAKTDTARPFETGSFGALLRESGFGNRVPACPEQRRREERACPEPVVGRSERLACPELGLSLSKGEAEGKDAAKKDF